MTVNQQLRSRVALRALTAAAFSVVPFGSAFAQDATAQPVERTDTSDEIVVTAQRRNERLLDVPISITALNSEMVKAASIAKISDLEKLVPNFSYNAAFGTANQARTTIRGITDNVRNAGFESGVSVYVDGVYAGRPEAQNLPLVNIEQVEVLRGPQGTFFGKNSIVGAINITTRKPTDEIGGEINIDLGNYNKRYISGFISGPVASNLFAAGSFFSNRRDGYVRNLFDNKDLGTEGASGGDVRLRYVPSDMLEVNVRAHFLSDDNEFYFPETLDGRGQFSTIVFAPGRFTTNIDGIPRESRRVFGLSGTIDYKIGDHTLTSITAFNRAQFNHSEDNDTTPLDSLLVNGWQQETQFASQEFRLTSPIGKRIDYIVGAYLFWQNVNSLVPFRFGANYPAGGRGDTNIYADVTTRSLAPFAQVNFHVSDMFTLTAGLRYTLEAKRLNDYHINSTGSSAPLFNFPSVTDKRTDSSFSPTLVASFKPTEDVNIYAKVAKGFKSGGWSADFNVTSNGARPDIATIDFDPEFATTYEIGLKSNLFNRRVSFSVAAFRTNYKDLQVQSRIPIPGTALFAYQFSNAASSVIKGFEAEATIKPLDGLSLRGAIGYTDGKYNDFLGGAVVNGQPINYSGNRIPDAPKWTWSILANYETPISERASFVATVDYSYKGDFFTDAANTPALLVPSRSLLGGKLGVRSGHWEIFIYGENLADEEYLTTLQGGATIRGTWGRPRTFGLQLGYKL